MYCITKPLIQGRVKNINWECLLSLITMSSITFLDSHQYYRAVVGITTGSLEQVEEKFNSKPVNLGSCEKLLF